MIRKLLEKLGIVKKKKAWWEYASGPLMLGVTGAIALVVLLAVIPLGLVKRDGVIEESAQKQSQVYRNEAMEEEYRSAVGPVLMRYLKSRSKYQNESADIPYSEWKALAKKTEDLLLSEVVPSYYKNFHLGVIISLSLEQSGLDDLMGVPSDTGGFDVSLDERGREKMKRAEERWADVLRGQDWLQL